MLQERKLLLHSEVDTGYSLVEAIYAKRAKLGEEEAKQLALESLSSLRYQTKEYLYVWTDEKINLAHIRADLVGKNVRDVGNREMIDAIDNIIAAIKSSPNGEAYVNTLFPKPNSTVPLPKLQFVKAFKPWGWNIGTGLYLDDLDQRINSLIVDLAIIFSIITGSIVVMAVLVARSIVSSDDALNKKSADMAAILENIPDGILTLDRDGKVQPEYSSQLERIIGNEEIAGKSIADLVLLKTELSAADVGEALHFVRNAVGKASSQFGQFLGPLREIRLMSPNGDVKELQLHWAPVSDSRGITRLVLLCIKDISESKLMDKQAAEQAKDMSTISEVLAAKPEDVFIFIKEAKEKVDACKVLAASSGSIDERIAAIKAVLVPFAQRSRVDGFLTFADSIRDVTTQLTTFKAMATHTSSASSSSNLSLNHYWKKRTASVKPKMLAQCDELAKRIDNYAKLAGQLGRTPGRNRRSGDGK